MVFPKRENPLVDTNIPYEHKPPDTKGGIVVYSSWYSWLVKMICPKKVLEIGDKENKKCLNIGSVARYICDMYLSQAKGQKPIIEQIIKKIPRDDRKTLDLQSLVDKVLNGLSEEETVPGNTDHVSDVMRKAKEIETITDVKGAQKIADELSAMENGNTLHASETLIDAVYFRVALLVSAKFPAAGLTECVEKAHTGGHDHLFWKNTSAALRECFYLKDLLEKTDPLLHKAPTTMTGLQGSLDSALESIKNTLTTNSPLSVDLSSLKKGIEDLYRTGLINTILDLDEEADPISLRAPSTGTVKLQEKLVSIQKAKGIYKAPPAQTDTAPVSPGSILPTPTQTVTRENKQATDSRSVNITIIQAEGKDSLSIEQRIESYQNSISEQISPPRIETAIHPIFVGVEDAFSAENQEDLLKIMDGLAKLSSTYKGVTIIPGKITLTDPRVTLIPVFENGRLVSMRERGANVPDIMETPHMFLLPNGLSVALGVGANAEQEVNEGKEELPVNQQPIDILILLKKTAERGTSIYFTPRLRIDAVHGRLSLFKKGTPLADSHSIVELPVAPMTQNSPQTIPLSQVCSSQELEDIKELLSHSEQDTSPSLPDMVQKRYSISGTKERPESIFSSDPHHFFSLLSRVRSRVRKGEPVVLYKGEPVILYTDNPAIPVCVYRNGWCNVYNDDKAFNSEIARTKPDVHAFSYSSYYNTISLAPAMKYREAYEKTTTEYTRKVEEIHATIDELCTRASMGSLDKESFDKLVSQQVNLEWWMRHGESISGFLSKKTLLEKYGEIYTATQTVIAFYQKSIVYYTEEEFKQTLATLQKALERLSSAVQNKPKLDALKLTAPIRAFASLYCLISLCVPEGSDFSVTIQDGRLNKTSIGEIPIDELISTLENLQPSFIKLANQLSSDDKKNVREGLSLLENKCLEQSRPRFFGLFPHGKRSLPEDLKKILQAIHEGLQGQ